MTKTKKIYTLILSISIMFLLTLTLCGFSAGRSPVAYAASAETVETEPAEGTEQEPVTPPETAETPAPAEESNPTFFGRIWEYVTHNYVGIATTVGDIALVIVVIVNHFKSKKKIVDISKKVNFTSTSQSDIVDVVNKLIEGYNTLDKKLAEYNGSEEKKYEAVGAMVVQTKAILEILSRVYANSKNIPQGVKDLVNLTYANALKATGDAELLKAEVDAAADTVNIEEPPKED